MSFHSPQFSTHECTLHYTQERLYRDMKNTVHSPAWESVACRNTSGNACSSCSSEDRTHWDTASAVVWWHHRPTCYQSHSFWSLHDVSPDSKPHVGSLYSHLCWSSTLRILVTLFGVFFCRVQALPQFLTTAVLLSIALFFSLNALNM
jgi:hypothetical protein